MLNNQFDIMYKTFAYQYMVGPSMPPIQLHSLGWQIRNSESYYFDGLKRPNEVGNCIFQYTLSGSGIFEINGVSYPLQEGTAFIAQIPSNHCYYFPKNNEQWEFLYFTIQGDYASREWELIQKNFGSVFALKKDSEVIKYLTDTYLLASNNKITDGYQTSSIAYEFLMKLTKSLAYPSTNDITINHKLEESIDFIKKNFHTELNIEDIAQSIQMSKFYYIHTFTQYKGITPWNYVTKLRIEHSIKLLLTTKESLEVISVQVGYRNANYFSKVFCKYVGLAPGKFRKLYHNVNEYTLNL